MNLTSDYYDKDYYHNGKGYYDYIYNGTFEKYAEDLIRMFNPRSTLEIGCAKGFLVKALRDKGVAAYGVDISEYAVSDAHPDAAEYLFVHDVTKPTDITFPVVDLIISIDTFEHIPEEHLETVWKFMRKCGRDYYVKVGTLKTPDWEHDASHITMHSIEWWQKKFPEVVFEESM